MNTKVKSNKKYQFSLSLSFSFSTLNLNQQFKMRGPKLKTFHFFSHNFATIKSFSHAFLLTQNTPHITTQYDFRPSMAPACSKASSLVTGSTVPRYCFLSACFREARKALLLSGRCSNRDAVRSCTPPIEILRLASAPPRSSARTTSYDRTHMQL